MLLDIVGAKQSGMSSPFCVVCSSWVQNLDLWSGDGGANGFASLFGGIVMEAHAC
jgi:hypothetical protein